MDGCAFISGEVATGTVRPKAAQPQALPPLDVRLSPINDRCLRALSFSLAAILHLAVMAAILHASGDALGEDGVSLESIAVSLVDSIPVLSAPETAASHAAVFQVLPDDANPTEQKAQPVEKAALHDLPPAPVPPPHEAISSPALLPEAAIREAVHEPPKQNARPAEPAAPPSPPAAPAALPSLSAAEATAGAVRAYARQVSGVLDRHKPRSGGLRGQLRIQFVVTTEGKAEPTRVLSSSGIARLDEIVVAAIQRMTFPPPPADMSLMQRTFNVPFAYR